MVEVIRHGHVVFRERAEGSAHLCEVGLELVINVDGGVIPAAFRMTQRSQGWGGSRSAGGVCRAGGPHASRICDTRGESMPGVRGE